jgi:hypothetical protein
MIIQSVVARPITLERGPSMATRADKLLELASVVRRSHRDALVVVGWYAANAPAEELDALLTLLREMPGDSVPRGHLAAVEERWAGPPSRFS